MPAAAPCIVPFAVPSTEPGRAAWAALLADAGALPNLKALLQRQLVAEAPDLADETSYSPPHERALARALRWQGEDGGLPWAARAAQGDGIDTGDVAWGLLSPVHWHVGTEQVGLVDPRSLLLDESESRALFDAVRSLFVDEGFVFAWGAPLRWYIAHESLAGLRTASLDRVVGRNVDAWLGAARDQPALRRIHRLQAEMQMLLHGHPLTEARAVRGLPVVNSFWLSGCGIAQPTKGPEPTLIDTLRRDALAGDWAAWAKGWELLDEGPLAELRKRAEGGEPVALTLCGERGARRFASPTNRPGPLAQLRRWMQPPGIDALTDML
jgi:hypothetical protein